MYFIANWKMNPPNVKETERLIKEIREKIKKEFLKNKAEVVICPPSIFLHKLYRPNSFIKLGVQNIGWEERGAFTGETSILMAKDAHAQYCIVNHSERKLYFGENEKIANKKIRLCLEKNITPIYCIGESATEKNKGKTKQVLYNQLKTGLEKVGLVNIRKVIITYEPLWTISTQEGSRPQTPDDLMGVIILIKRILRDLYDEKTARSVSILYGGSVNAKNVIEYAKQSSIDGFLIGSASLNPIGFASIIKKVMEMVR